MSNPPTLNDISAERVQEIGVEIKNLSVGDHIRVTNNQTEYYVVGKIVEKRDEVDGEHYERILVDPDGVLYELHVNWRDIPPNSSDQETPYTGLLEEPFNDTAPAVTDIIVS